MTLNIFGNTCFTGAICVSKDGDVGVFWTAHRMPWAYQKGAELHHGVELGEDTREESIVK